MENSQSPMSNSPSRWSKAKAEIFRILLSTVASVFIIYAALNPTYRNGDNEVVIYTTSWCPYCSALRKCLSESGVPFVEKDVEKSVLAGLEHLTLLHRGVPDTLIGSEVVQGLNKPRLTELLGKAGHPIQCWSS